MGAQKYHDLYEQYRKVSMKEWTSRDPVAIAKDFHKADKKVEIKDEKAFGTVLIMAAKVAHQCSYDEFSEFMETCEMPPIKLSKEEMKILKGGMPGWLKVGLGVVGVAAAGYGLYKMGQNSQKDKINQGLQVGVEYGLSSGQAANNPEWGPRRDQAAADLSTFKQENGIGGKRRKK